MKSWLRQRWTAYGVLLALLVTVAIAGWIAVGSMRNEVRQAGFTVNGIGDTFWLEREFSLLQRSLARFGAGDQSVSHERLMLHFDLFWSRCQLIIESPSLARLREEFPVGPLAERMLAHLEELEPLVLNLQRGDYETAGQVIAGLDIHGEALKAQLVAVEAYMTDQIISVRNAFERVLTYIDALSIGTSAVLSVILAMFLAEAATARGRALKIEQREAELRQLAYFDPLTDLRNRRGIETDLGERLSQHREGSISALIAIDLDGFKLVNDTYGHKAGDLVLRQTAERIEEVLRPGDIAGRTGGDEFLVFIDGLVSREDLQKIADRLLQRLNEPIVLPSGEAQISACAGLTLMPDDGTDLGTLAQRSDLALYKAKDKSRGAIVRFHHKMEKVLLRRNAIERRLRAALAENALELHFQPQVTLSTGSIEAVEVLLRWTDAELGCIGPGEFVAVAEETGLIDKLDDWVLRRAAAMASQWHGALKLTRVAINQSAFRFAQPGFADTVEEVLTLTGLEPWRLELEVTETALLNPSAETIRLLGGLRDMGVKIAIDDFGVGYSSLSYLKSLPIDQLKIDRSFVGDIESDANDRAIVDAICHMAKSLELEVVAEGIETQSQREYVSRIGCDRGQGYFFSKPVDLDELRRLMDNQENHQQEFA